MFKILYELLIFIIITAGSSGLTLITSVGTAIEAAESEVGTVSVRLTRGPAGVHRPRAGGRGQRRHRGTRPGASSVNTGVSEESFILLVEGCGLSTVNVEPGEGNVSFTVWECRVTGRRKNAAILIKLLTTLALKMTAVATPLFPLGTLHSLVRWVRQRRQFSLSRHQPVTDLRQHD